MTSEQRPVRVLEGALADTALSDDMWVLPGQGNALAARTDDGVVLIDAGNRLVAPVMIESLRRRTDERVAAIIYSHGHLQYNAAVPLWLAHNHGREEAPPRLIGHRNVLERYERYRETAGLQARAWKHQFGGRVDRPLADYDEEVTRDLHDPTEVFADRMVVASGSRPVELIWAPSETHDALAVWFPEDGLLFGGAATPGDAIPNIGTPLRTQRFTIRWADTLDRLADLGAERLLTEFGPLVQGAAQVEHRLRSTAEALRWLRDEVVDRMNRGMGEAEIVADMTYPAEMFDQPWMTPNYGAADYIVRDLWREENGWWDRNPTNLHPAPPDEAAAAVLSAIDDHELILERARELADDGETQLALHVIDLLAAAPGMDGAVGEAKVLKAALCLARAKEIEPYVSRACYRSSARLLKQGTTSWTAQH